MASTNTYIRVKFSPFAFEKVTDYCEEELGLKQKQVEMAWCEQHALYSTLPGHPATTRRAGERQNLIDLSPGYTMHRQTGDMPLLYALKQQL